MARDGSHEGSSSFLLDLLTIAFANRRLRWSAAALLAAPLLFYVVEDLSVRWRVPPRDAFGQVTVHRYYALHKSRDKMSIVNTEPEAQTCVHAVFPHAGYPPCWYLARHAEQRVDFQ